VPSGVQVSNRPRKWYRWWLNRSVRAKGLTVIAIPLMSLIVITSAGLALQAKERQQRNNSIAELNLTNAAAAVLADAVNAEAGVRGYAATDDPIFLPPYSNTLAGITREERTLGAAAAIVGDLDQQRSVDATITRVLSELGELRSLVGNGASSAGLRSAMESQKTTMDLLSRQMAALVRAPTARRLVQRTNIAGLETTIDELDIAGLIVGILTGLAGVALFTSGISRRIVAAAANADRLGAGQALEPLEGSQDELGRLAHSLVRAEDLLASREADLIAARDKALQATQAKNAFLSHTSHELRTPLNSILGFAQLLGKANLSGQDHEDVERILGAGRHLLALINELIDIARIESGDLNLSIDSVSVLPLIEEASRLLGPLAAERSITISCDCANRYLAAYADQQRFSQIIVNLLSNAIKYNRRGGRIMVNCESPKADQVSVVVSDTGAGLSPDDLERIFLPFERLDAGQTDTEGTGIGLPLARALAEAMDGRLSASSIRGEGSAFTVTLPRAPDVARLPARSAAPGRRARFFSDGGEVTKVLYIEDNPSNIELVARFLNGMSQARLVSATSGRSGMELAVREVPDIILLDLDLVDLHGSQVLNELKSEPITRAIPVVIVSADATPSSIRRLLASGALAYLTKPIDLDQLAKLVGSVRQDRNVSHATT
jgi:signal transduction histidine kinase/ActR/RegA family two-component response regulator